MGSKAHRRNGILEAWKGGDEDNLGLVVLFEDGRCQCVTFAVWQFLVQEHHIHLAGGAGRKSLGASMSHKDLKLFVLEIVADSVAKNFFVVDDEERFPATMP